jgi:hypothetical protein
MIDVSGFFLEQASTRAGAKARRARERTRTRTGQDKFECVFGNKKRTLLL